ncbi:MAG: HDOD domain-containing protein [Desulfonatronovibrio sp.]|nr:HDOD domain-containing protein [Desulfovibrionales bacterium]
MEKIRVLFVDDVQNILDGLKRMLRPMRGEWELLFASSGKEALKIMEEQPVDVIISDMKMPGMDGAQLLTETMNLYPGTVRIILSAHSDMELAIKTVLPAHQYLSKPCTSEQIKQVIKNIVREQKLLKDKMLKSVISKISSFPALSETYNQLSKELTSSEPSMSKIGEIISRDVGICAKILKLVNSSFFGFCRNISSPEQATSLLGLKVMRALVLSIQVFSIYDFSKVPGFSLKNLWEHSLASARLSEKLGRIEGLTKTEIDDCYIAGLMHDVGKLVLASELPEQYNEILGLVRKNNRPVYEVEKEIMGTSHAEVGAYLMGVWGLPDGVINGLALHHAPELSEGKFNSATAVYAANILERKYYIINTEYHVPEFDMEYLSKMSLTGRLSVWEELALTEGRANMKDSENLTDS